MRICIISLLLLSIVFTNTESAYSLSPYITPHNTHSVIRQDTREENSVDIFGHGLTYSETHDLVTAGHIIQTTTYTSINGYSLVTFVKKYLKKNHFKKIRIYFDYDNTIFRPMGWLSSSNWFVHISNVYGHDTGLEWWGRSKQQHSHETRQMKNGIFFRLTEACLAGMINELQSMPEVETVGLTARAETDRDRTIDILNAFNIKFDQAIFCDGAEHKLKEIQKFEKENGSLPAFFLEDSFKNLVSVVGNTPHITGIHYANPDVAKEDTWTYDTYIEKAYTTLGIAQNSITSPTHKELLYQHAFEYFYNAVIQLLTLHDISREQAYTVLEKIHETLVQDFAPHKAPYHIHSLAQLQTLTAHGANGTSYYFEDTIGKHQRSMLIRDKQNSLMLKAA